MYRSGIDDFGIADTMGNTLGTLTQIALGLCWTPAPAPTRGLYAYAMNLDPEPVFDLVAGVRDCHTQLGDDLTAFAAVLDDLDKVG